MDFALFPTLFFVVLKLASNAAADIACADPSALVPLLRAFNGGDHFYTTNVTEMDQVAISLGGYSFEGEAAFIWTTQQPGTVPLFRLYNKQKNDHFYTISPDELGIMLNLGWTYDTAINHTAGYVYPYSICGASPIYQLFNPKAVDHFYTMDVDESIRSQFQNQGIAGYAILPSANGTFVPGSAKPFFLPTSVSATAGAQVSSSTTSTCANPSDAIPLLRAYNRAVSDHFYTINSTEMAGAEPGYGFEGDAAFVWSTQDGTTVPLYRLFNQALNDHFYTIDPTEADQAQQSGYAFDITSNAGYVYPYSVCGASPIYRMYSDSLKDHFYTMSITESQNADNKYVIEGVVGYALLSSVDGLPQTATASASPLFLPVEIASASSVLLTLAPSGVPAATTTFGFDSTFSAPSPTTTISHNAASQKPLSLYTALGLATIAMWISL
ncbi:hypothetical protein D9757_005536 [Collybiopsis confluens]|uniref:DUF5648 domain-containing protein n=1 Tax=Collybiopsis confluens TaxID=2823264 RepID=A0A8H5M9Q1_9AGAR|nr:hypothetical protein D9757_005536 [Collybiopsis confluens]